MSQGNSMEDYSQTSNRGITGVVLAGGRSSRFGQDKGLFVFQNKPLVLHAIDILSPLCNELLISTNRKSDYAFTGHDIIEDIYKECGPIGGIHSGLHHATNNLILFLGCDMPFVPTLLMDFLLSHLSECQVVVPQHHGFRETLCLAMEKSTIEYTQQAIVAQKLRILDMLQLTHTCFPEVANLPFYSPAIFSNINYRKDIDNY